MSTKKIKIAPSVLACDFSKLTEQLQEAEKAGADLFHIDIMDGHFVPNLTFGPKVVECLKKITSLPLDLHLMIYKPENFIDKFIDAGANNITLHIESTQNIESTFEKIKNLGVTSGISLNPNTHIDKIKKYLDISDFVLVMSVNPGFCGQKFIKSTLDKIKSLKNIKQKNKFEFLIEVDGGVGPQNAEIIVKNGADILVAGNSIFGTDDIKSAIKNIRNKAEKRIDGF